MRSVSIPARQIGQNRPRNGKAGSPKRKKHYPIGLLALQRVMSMPHDQQRHQPQTVAARRSCDWRRRRQAPPTAMKSRRDGRRLVMEDDEDERRDDGGFFLTAGEVPDNFIRHSCKPNFNSKVKYLSKDDTEKLRRIGLVRMSSVGAQLNLVFELLYMTRQALTAEQINVATYVHVHGNKVVFDCLRNNQKVHFDGIRFSYKSKYDLKGRDQLLSLIGEFPGVLPVVDVKDAYLAVLGDLKSLLALTPICPSCSWT
uniref:TFIIE beta domain-containing protein n=1 Tax=Leersia perrieri TaxID=77586 RepID=A0A0D9VQ58_9ORYZ